MPNNQQQWNAINKIGNPTKSKDINSLIKAVKKIMILVHHQRLTEL
jgi:hypothetical protein